MTPAEMQVGIPYVVTRGSAALGLVRGDRVEMTSRGELVAGWKFFRYGWKGYLFAIEPDRAGILERITELEIQIKTLKEMLG